MCPSPYPLVHFLDRLDGDLKDKIADIKSELEEMDDDA